MHVRRVLLCDTLLHQVTALAGDGSKVTLQSIAASFDAGRRRFEQGIAAEGHLLADRVFHFWQEPPHRLAILTRPRRHQHAVTQILRVMQRQLVVAKQTLVATHLTGCWHHANVVGGAPIGRYAIHPMVCPGGIRSAAATTAMAV